MTFDPEGHINISPKQLFRGPGRACLLAGAAEPAKQGTPAVPSHPRHFAPNHRWVSCSLRRRR